jgi:hypothetical protein
VTLFNLDDACDDERTRKDLLRLEDLKADIPTLKVTLFTIPGRCSPTWVREMKVFYDWCDLVPHGWMHRNCYECASWKKADCKAALRAAREMGFTTKGFKAPGWQISDGCYEALAEEDYWIADQWYNNERSRKFCIHAKSPGLRRYLLSSERIKQIEDLPTIMTTTPYSGGYIPIHGHIGHLGGRNANALELIMSDIRAAAAKDSDFRFINEVMG